MYQSLAQVHVKYKGNYMLVTSFPKRYHLYLSKEMMSFKNAQVFFKKSSAHPFSSFPSSCGHQANSNLNLNSNCKWSQAKL